MIGDVYMFGQARGVITEEAETKVFFEISDPYGNSLTSRWVDKVDLKHLYFLRNTRVKQSTLRLVQ